MEDIGDQRFTTRRRKRRKKRKERNIIRIKKIWESIETII